MNRGPLDLGNYEQASKEVERRVKASKTSFYWGMRSQPEEKRRAIFAVYAFCRAVDDIADSNDPVEDKIKGLDEWRNRIDNLYKSAPKNPVCIALLPAVATFNLDKKSFLAVIDGMEMDARGPIQGPSRGDFDLYIARVASAVGLLCVRIFGEADKEGEDLAHHLGRAFQITNILRDLREDADWDRLYLPRDLLNKYGIEKTKPLKVLYAPNLDKLCRELAEVAEEEFKEAEAIMARCDPAKIKPARVMRDAYYKTLQKLKKRGWSAEAVNKPKSALEKITGRIGKLVIFLKHGLS